MTKYYNQFHKRAIEAGKFRGPDHALWMHDLLKRLVQYWEEPDTPLPDIDLFDECTKAVDLSD